MLRDNQINRKNKGSKRYTFIAFAVFAQLFISTHLYAKELVSVGVVNVTYLMEKAPQSEVASAQLKRKFSPQETKLALELDELNKLEVELDKIKESKKNLNLQRQKERELRSRKRIRSRSLQDFREELRFARDSALDDVQKEVFRAIDEVRVQQNIDIVLQDYVSASQSDAKEGEISFVSNPKYVSFLEKTNASAVILSQELAEQYSGRNSFIGAGSFIGANSRIDENVTIHPNVSLYSDTEVGSGCIFHSGVVIGADGFGFAPTEDKKWYKIPQIGNCVDKVVQLEPEKSITAIKNVTINEPFFNGHFPAQPIMPGVLIVEALAQATGLLGFKTMSDEPQPDLLYVLAGIDKVKFKQQVVPGDQLELYAEIIRHKGPMWIYNTEARVNGHPSAELAEDVEVSAYAVIGAGVSIDSGTWIGPHAVIEGPTTIGKENRIFQFAFCMGTSLGKDLPPFIMATGAPGVPRGINNEGLKRHGYSSEERATIKKAYKNLYLKNLTLSDAIAELENAEDSHTKLMTEFCQRSQAGQATFEGIAGKEMQQAGCKTLYAMDRLSLMGFSEVLPRYLELTKLRNGLIKDWIQNPPDVFVGIDAPDFNLKIEKKLFQSGVPAVHYVSPSFWAWREGLAGDDYILAVLPGSRMGEIKRIAPDFLEGLKLIHEKHPEWQFVTPLINEKVRNEFDTLKQHIAPNVPMTYIDGQSRLVMQASDQILMASGTAVLEGMLVGRPMVAAYRVAPTTAKIIRLFKMIKSKYYTLPNNLANEYLVPELIQEDVTPINVFKEVEQQFSQEKKQRDHMLTRFDEIHKQLAQGASKKAAQAIVTMLEAGAVVAAAVILDPKKHIEGLADSKKLSEKKRNELNLEIREKALCWSLGRAEVDEIDDINILQASLLAMKRAVEGLSICPDHVKIDGNRGIDMDISMETIVKGDSKVAAISAASIIAKVARDKEMIELDTHAPRIWICSSQRLSYETTS
ncbi:Lipid-A-disaccharide synthase [Nymphon striatum]|nr:Lipid-A-disaccharide synthase [Nymphon striatum]